MSDSSIEIPSADEIARVQTYQRHLQCSAVGHPPCIRIGATFSDPVGYFACNCGAVTWHPRENG